MKAYIRDRRPGATRPSRRFRGRSLPGIEKKPSGAWPSSANQEIHLLTDRYQANDFINLLQAEITITAESALVETGFRAVMSQMEGAGRLDEFRCIS